MLIEYKNGNATVSLYEDGTRVVQTDDDYLQLDQPLNIDIRLLNRCSNGYNPITGRAICAYCHEYATTNGNECDYELLKTKLEHLHSGIELALGGNDMTCGLIEFIQWGNSKGFIMNMTVNQLHLIPFGPTLKELMEGGLIKGLGISYRKGFNIKIDPFFINYPNSVLHHIVGIDTVEEVLNTPFNKVLILGYKKEVGLGESYYSNYSQQIEEGIRKWQMYLPKLFGKKLISFDNLAIEQLQVDRFFTPEDWNTFYQQEHSMYINAVDAYYAPSSRAKQGLINWDDMDLKTYYQSLREGGLLYD